MGKASSPRCFKAECSPDLGTGRSALFGDYYLSCARASLRQVVVSSGRPSVRPSACSHWVPLRVAPSSNLLSSPLASVRRADYFRPPRYAQTPAECFLSVRFAPDYLVAPLRPALWLILFDQRSYLACPNRISRRSCLRFAPRGGQR